MKIAMWLGRNVSGNGRKQTICATITWCYFPFWLAIYQLHDFLQSATLLLHPQNDENIRNTKNCTLLCTVSCGLGKHVGGIVLSLKAEPQLEQYGM